jgi:hypothetical protein
MVLQINTTQLTPMISYGPRTAGAPEAMVSLNMLLFCSRQADLGSPMWGFQTLLTVAWRGRFSGPTRAVKSEARRRQD